MLEQVVISGTEAQIREAIDRAKGIGLAEEVKQAEMGLRRTEAREELSKALERERLGELRTAIQHAKECNLKCSELATAIQVLERQEMRNNLTFAIAGKDVAELEAAIQAVQQASDDGFPHGIRHEEMQEAR